MSEDMKPTPIEDPDTRRRMEALRRDALGGPYSEIVEEIARRTVPNWRLMQAKMAHDGAMRRALYSLEGQADNRRFLMRLGWWGVGTMTAILLLVVTQCSTGQYGGTVLDDPDHYSRRCVTPCQP